MKSRQEIKALAKEAMREQKGKAILLPFVLMVATLVSIGLDFLALFVAGWVAYTVVFLIGLFILMVMAVNMAGEYVKIYNRETASVGALFTELKVNFFRKLGGIWWVVLWLFLWGMITAPITILGNIVVGVDAITIMETGTIEPGSALLMLVFYIPMWVIMIIKGLQYFMMEYILASHPAVKALAALRFSKRITKGHKGKLFVMVLSFLGWIILASLPAGILSGVGTVLDSGLGLALMAIGYLLSGLIYILFLGPYMYTTYAGFFVELRDNAIEEGRITREELGMEA